MGMPKETPKPLTPEEQFEKDLKDHPQKFDWLRKDKSGVSKGK